MIVKKKNNQMHISARSLPCDNALSSTSNNALKNKKIYEILGGALSTLTTTAKTIIGAINELKSDLTDKVNINSVIPSVDTIQPIFNYTISGGGWNNIVYSSKFVAGHWYVCVSKLDNELAHVEIKQCTTDGQMNISSIAGQSVLGTEGFAIFMS